MFKRYFLIVSWIILLALTGCKSKEKIGEIEDGYTNFGSLSLAQLQYPEKGEDIMVLDTELGEIKIKLLTDGNAEIIVPKIIELIDNNILDNMSFSSINKNSNIAIENEDYEKKKGVMDEEENEKHIAWYLKNASVNIENPKEGIYETLNGSVSLSYRTSDPNKPFARLAIFINEDIDETFFDMLDTLPKGYEIPKDLVKAYKYLGGNLNGDSKYVFGQVFYGLDVVKKINNLTLDENRFPIDGAIKINSIKIIPFEGKRWFDDRTYPSWIFKSV